MRKTIFLIKSCFKYEFIFIIIMFFVGCTSIERGNLIQPYYKPVFMNDQPETKVLGAIHINTIEFDKPSMDNHWITFPIRSIKIVPGLSLIPLVDRTCINSCPYNSLNEKIILQKGELEEILVSEMRNTGLFSEVGSQGTQGDYDVKGRVNFTIENYTHYSGLGFMYLGMIWTFFLPLGTDYYTCEAHFEVISLKDNKVILSKDYKAEVQKYINLFNPQDNYNIYDTEISKIVIGEQIFPNIVRDFISDININIQKNL